MLQVWQSGAHCARDRLFHVGLVLLLAVASVVPFALQPDQTGAVALGNGVYEVTASVFGTEGDGLVGEMTSSGHVLQRFDRLVALPACTESSCPWVPRGTGVEGRWGPQTTCAEADGLCWVEIVSPDTGRCVVAPVLDRGPLFVRDNWWAPRSQRTYPYERGVPAAEIARDGVDLGFGPGISDRGYDVANDFTYAAAIDLAAGTWADLGLDFSRGIADVRVRLLWQAGVSHYSACGGTGYGNATTTDDLNLRAGPSLTADIITVMPAGSRVGIIGPRRGEFYPITYPGTPGGWASGDYLRPDGGSGPAAIVSEALNLRTGPSTADSIITVMPAGSLVTLTGDGRNGFLSVNYRGRSGWAYEQYLETGSTAHGTARTTDWLNLRASPSLDAEILTVMPPRAQVELTGSERNGFLRVRYEGRTGWAYGEYLTRSATVREDLNLREGPSTSDDIITVMPAGARVTLTGERRNGFVRVVYDGRRGWAYAAYLSI
ncbi:MAG TPA: SH3 domain-containing protein [Thermomicrobiales bacterium]